MKTPPLLIGAAILFWGFEAGQPVLAAFMAVAVEASRWIKYRWDFKEADFKRVSTLCTLALLSIVFYRFLTGWFNHAAWMILKWLPGFLLPLLLAQAYSTAGRINLSALFLFRKKHVPTDQGKPRFIDLSYIYLASCVLSAGFANTRDGLFYVGMLGLAGWALWSYRSRRLPLGVWIVLVLVAAGAGYLAQMGLSRLQTVVEQKTAGWYSKPSQGSYRKYTQIGEILDEKLSGRIVFRARAGGIDERSLLLREATYDTFRSKLSIWSASRKDFNRLKKSSDSASWRLATGTGDTRNYRIAQYFKSEDTLLKLPSGAFQIDGLKVAKAEKNDFGAVKVRGDGLMTYHIRYGLGSALISPPGTPDLKIPKRESKVIEHIADQLNLQSLQPSEILKKVETYFATQFTYSLKQKSKQKNSTPIVNFLSNTRSGHCELFATATVLLLRQAGIPARYARGYCVDPSDTMDGWSLVRARHAHAWTVAYIDNNWVNLDTTPGTWQEMERQQEPHWKKYWQKIKDFVSGLMFRFAQWRQEMQTRGYLKYFPLLLLLLFLWPAGRIMAKFLKRRKFQKTAVPQGQKIRPTAGADSAFYRIEQRLNGLGLRRYQWETLSGWMSRIERTAGPTLSLDIPRKSLRLHYRYRFDPQGLSASEKSRMTSMISAWLAENHLKSVAPQNGPDP
jgi:transglutaminase-like putative cysteine protease